MKSTTSITLALFSFALCIAATQRSAVANPEQPAEQSQVSEQQADPIKQVTEPQGCVYVPGYGWVCG